MKRRGERTWLPLEELSAKLNEGDVMAVNALTSPQSSIGDSSPQRGANIIFCYLRLDELLGDLDALGLGELGKPLLDLLVGGDDAAQAAAEQVLVKVLDLAG